MNTIENMGFGDSLEIEGKTYRVKSRLSSHVDHRKAESVQFYALGPNENLVAIKHYLPMQRTQVIRSNQWLQDAVRIRMRTALDPNTVATYLAEYDPDRRINVMNWIEGESLATLLRAGLSVEEYIELCVALIQEGFGKIIRECLENGVIHRDINSGNVIVKKDDICVSVAAIDPDHITPIDDKTNRGKHCAGVARFLAPEIMTGKQHATADFYSLACLLIQLLHQDPDMNPNPGTSKDYPGNGNDIKRYDEIEAKPTVAFSSIVKAKPHLENSLKKVIAVVKAIMKKDPSARPQQPRDVLQIFEAA